MSHAGDRPSQYDSSGRVGLLQSMNNLSTTGSGRPSKSAKEPSNSEYKRMYEAQQQEMKSQQQEIKYLKDQIYLRKKYEAVQQELQYLKNQWTEQGTSEQQQIVKAEKLASQLDVCFLMDASSSMQEAFEMVQDKIMEIAGYIRESYEYVKLRVALVAYRDFENGPADRLESFDFVDLARQKENFQKFVRGVKAFSGDGSDWCEDVHGGLQEVTQLNWQSTTRVVVHIADAPCHGREFHNMRGKGDKYPDGDPEHRDMQTLLKKLGALRVQSYFFAHLHHSTKKMIERFKELAGRPDEWIWELDDAEMSNIPAAIAKVCNTSISASMANAMQGNTQVQPPA